MNDRLKNATVEQTTLSGSVPTGTRIDGNGNVQREGLLGLHHDTGVRVTDDGRVQTPGLLHSVVSGARVGDDGRIMRAGLLGDVDTGVRVTDDGRVMKKGLLGEVDTGVRIKRDGVEERADEGAVSSAGGMGESVGSMIWEQQQAKKREKERRQAIKQRDRERNRRQGPLVLGLPGALLVPPLLVAVGGGACGAIAGVIARVISWFGVYTGFTQGFVWGGLGTAALLLLGWHAIHVEGSTSRNLGINALVSIAAWAAALWLLW